MANLIGKWDLEKSENFEEFLNTLDLPDAIKTLVASIKPTLVVTQSGDDWSILNIMPGAMNHEVKFKDGIEFEEGDCLLFRYNQLHIYIEAWVGNPKLAEHGKFQGMY